MAKSENFDFEAFQKTATYRIRSGSPLFETDGVFTPLLKAFLEAALEAEMAEHLDGEESSNRRNGHGKKQVKTNLGTKKQSPRPKAASFPSR